ncbi:MAG: mechanosensitive ion channel [Deltaproteobacteria bacterium]|nr:mechanosensitive ion channel [Deltaproteobacteria bacterium]MBN2672363.1 mechanosensitive ion channel [Deltaproteobacteria bacterium]
MLDRILAMLKESSETVIAVTAVIVVAIVLYQLSKRGLYMMLKRGKLATPVVSTLIVLLRWTFLIVALLLVLQQIGVLQNVWAALLAVGATIAIGFVAGWSILSNVFSTLLVLIYRPFRIGDIVDIPADSVKGHVIDINFMYTTMKTPEDAFVQVPNNTFFMKPVIRTPGKQSISLYEQLNSDSPFKA